MADYIYPADSISANTESLVCEECSGSTFNVVPPHAIWTDGQNNTIIQMNTITLGGINGLNS